MVEKRWLPAMFEEVTFALPRTAATAESSIMKAFAHLAPTVPAIFVAAIGMSLTVYLLHGARVQGEPAPLLAVIGGAAGRVAADLPATVEKHAAEPVGRAASSAQQATTPSVQFVPRRRTAATTAHSVHRSARSGVVRRGSSVPRQATAFAAAATPVTMRAPTAKATAVR